MSVTQDTRREIVEALCAEYPVLRTRTPESGLLSERLVGAMEGGARGDQEARRLEDGLQNGWGKARSEARRLAAELIRRVRCEETRRALDDGDDGWEAA